MLFAGRNFGGIGKNASQKILISNSLAKMGETQGFSVADFAAEIEKYMQTNLDYVLYHNKPLDKALLAAFQKEFPQISGALKIDGDLPPDKFIGRDIYQKGKIAFDPKKVVREIFKLINYKR